MNQPKNPIHFLRTTAIGGLLFLLPLIVIGALIGQVVPVVLSIAEVLDEGLGDWFPELRTPAGIALLILISIAILLLLCFAAGLLARRSLARGFSKWFEKNLVMLFPRYAIIKEQMADTMGSRTQPTMKPVVVRFDDTSRIAFETERCDQTQQVAVYLPGSPDPWSGKVALVGLDRVEPLEVEFGVAVATCEQMGRGTAAVLAKSQSDDKA